MIETTQNNLSNNKALSDNKMSLWGDFNIDIDFKELALLFFPAVRSAMIQTKLLELYKVQADTVASILYKAKEIADKTGIQIQTLPAKFGLPVLEKMSLEIDDTEMQEQWAKLLVAAGKDYNSIHIQYADILSKIGGNEARILKEIYNYQRGYKYLYNDVKEEIKDYDEKCLIADAANAISGGMEVGDVIEDEGMYSLHRSSNTPEIHINVSYPENVTLYDRLYLFDNKVCNETGVSFLEQLGLIKKYIDSGDICLVLTEEGYDFINTLDVK